MGKEWHGMHSKVGMHKRDAERSLRLQLSKDGGR